MPVRDDRPLMTTAESKAVGWEDEMIPQYPEMSDIVGAISSQDRITLVRWYRYLDSPKNSVEVARLDAIIAGLKAGCPVEPKPKKLQSIGPAEVLGGLLDGLGQEDSNNNDGSDDSSKAS